MDFRRFRFLFLGLESVYQPQDCKHETVALEKLVEPQGSIKCRRNIIVLSGVLFLAGLAGADLHSLDLFGIRLPSERGIVVLGCAALIAQIYWFVLRYQHIKDDASIERDQSPEYSLPVKISETKTLQLVRRDADLFSNRVAVFLTLSSWCFIVPWVIDGLS